MVQNLKWETFCLRWLRNCHATIVLVMSVMMRRGILGVAVKKNVASAM